ncbi:pyridoxal-phosphate dependent enzyme [Halopseudomonas pachastrellae]|nr:pyridoxal-phosphate dependent enzyme [Halopseudomonas pachastrellae]
MPLVLQTGAGLQRGPCRARVHRRAGSVQRRVRRPPQPAVFRRAPDRAIRRRKDLLQARRVESHRRAQDQQLHRSGPAGPPHGQTGIIAETGAGMHGVATATVCARFGLQCVVYMGRDRHSPSARQRRPHAPAGRRDRACDLRHRHPERRHERGAARLGNQRRQHLLHDRHRGRPAPYPTLVRDFQSIIGREAHQQMLAREGRLPDSLVACIGGRLQRDGLFHPFLDYPEVQMVGVEAAGHGIDTGLHAASLKGGTPGVCTATAPICCRMATARLPMRTRSPRSGLSRHWPEHAWLHEQGRVEYVAVTDQQALDAFHNCCRTEGIIPALETSHARRSRPPRTDAAKDHLMVVCLSGRVTRTCRRFWRQACEKTYSRQDMQGKNRRKSAVYA